MCCASKLIISCLVTVSIFPPPADLASARLLSSRCMGDSVQYGWSGQNGTADSPSTRTITCEKRASRARSRGDVPDHYEAAAEEHSPAC